MPYKGPNDARLPSNVKKFGAKDRRQWVSIFNGTYKSCRKGGGKHITCESKAFRIANGVLKKKTKEKSMRKKKKLLDKLLSVIREEIPNVERASGLRSLYDQLWSLLSENKETRNAWPIDIYYDAGKLYAIVAKKGLLYRTELTIDNGEMAIGDLKRVEIKHVPVKTRTRVFRDKATGRARWVSISNTAVLNREAQIDTRDLFDSFVEHAQETGEYPYRTFFHQGEKFRTGQCDFMAREKNVFITSGIYDEDNFLADAEIKALERDGDYWGESIGFYPSEDPEMVEIAADVRVPCYRDGVIEEISTLPESRASAHFTLTRVATMEVKRMRDDVEKALRKLIGSDEDTDEFIESVDMTNRSIEEDDLVTRETDEETETTESGEGEGETGESEEGESEESEGEESEGEEEEGDLIEGTSETFEVNLDEEAVRAISSAIAESGALANALKPLLTRIDTLEASVGEVVDAHNAIAKQAEKQLNDVARRLEKIESEDEQRIHELVSDMPRRSLIQVGYRPTNVKRDSDEDDEEESGEQAQDSDAIAKEFLESLPPL